MTDDATSAGHPTGGATSAVDADASGGDPAVPPPDDAGVHAVDAMADVAAETVTDEQAPADDAIPVVADVADEGATAAVAPDLPFLPAPSGWTDSFTALDGPIYWARLLSGEGARIKRYRRPATVALFQIVALDRLARQWGEDVAVQCTLQVARTLSRHIRSSDHAVRLGPARFGAYLPETNEIDAINFVERCRAAVARDVGVAAETITLAIGWAGPVDGDLGAAVELAEARLEREIQAVS